MENPEEEKVKSVIKALSVLGARAEKQGRSDALNRTKKSAKDARTTGLHRGGRGFKSWGNLCKEVNLRETRNIKEYSGGQEEI